MMKWNQLREYLWTVPEEGENGFEGLVGQVVSLTTGEKLRLASKGLQPGGDASSDSGSVAVQAKRYRETTPLNHSEILGDVDRALGTHFHLDTYILATTRSIPNQLRNELSKMEEGTGLDIVTLGFGDADPDIGILCVQHWPALCDTKLFSKAPKKLADELWVAHNGGTVGGPYEIVSRSIRERWRTWNTLIRMSQKHLGARFCITGSQNNCPPYEIALQNAVSRSVLIAAIDKWWKNSTSLACIVEGQEGVGKSWGTAQAVTKIQQRDNVPICWLDSIDWAGCKSPLELIQIAVEKLVYCSPDIRERWTHKILHRFVSPMLIVLDGANERGAILSAEKLLHELASHEEYGQHLRFLFTTRLVPGADHLWRRCNRIAVHGFDDDELKWALSNDAGLKVSDVPPGLLPILRLPRYFARSIQLMDRFSGIQGVTRELLLWEDLKSRIEELDIQIRDRLGFHKAQDADEVLQMLAKEVTIHSSSKPQGEASRSLLDECFGGRYSEIRDDLLELRIVREANLTSASISDAHVTLGWALILHAISRDSQTLHIDEQADRLRRQLEPLASVDCRNEALFAALQMTAEDSPVSETESVRRAALMLVWYSNHNVLVPPKRLTYWAERDLPTYLRFVDELYTNIDISGRENAVIGPLALVWKQGLDKNGVLRKRLRQWMLLTWRHDQASDLGTVVSEGHELPVARTENQLRLSAVALSIISQRPDIGVLPDLALCTASETLSKAITQGQEWPVKHLDKNFTMLMRWGYTDTVIPELARLATNARQDGLLLQGYRYLNAYLSPQPSIHILQLPAGEEWRTEHSESTIEAIRATQSPFLGTKGEHIGWFIESDVLAIRYDLPQLTKEAQNRLRQTYADLCARFSTTKTDSGTESVMQLEPTWTWSARLDPAFFNKETLKFLYSALRSTLSCGLLHRFSRLKVTSSAADQDSLFSEARLAGERLLAKIESNMSADFHNLCLITEIVLLNCREEQFMEWVCWLGENPSVHYVINLYPICQVLWEVKSQPLAREAERQARIAGDTWQTNKSANAASKVAFWVCLWHYTGVPDPDAYEWAWQLARVAEMPDEPKRNLYELAAKSAPERFASDLFGDAMLRTPLSRHQLRSVLLHTPEVVLHVPKTVSYEQMLVAFPVDYAGWVVSESSRENDLARWGCEVMNVAIRLASTSGPTMTTRVGTEFRLSSDGRIQMFAPGHWSAKQELFCASANTWGIDMGDTGEMNERSEKARISAYDGEVEAWQADYESLIHWDGFPFHAFEAREALMRWAQRHTQEFYGLARRYLDALGASELNAFHLGFFTKTILWIWREMEFDCAGCIAPPAKVLTFTHILDEYRVESMTAQLWKSRDHERPDYANERRKYLLACENDEQIMQSAIAAMVGGTTSALWPLCREFLDDEKACMRNLALSLLPWLGSDEGIAAIEHVRRNDASGWTRQHASWAIEVAEQERSCRVWYKQLLVEDDIERLSAGLQAIEPALLPPCRWWHREYERESGFWNCDTDPGKRALLITFWNHWGSLSSHQQDIKAFGRKLTEWCRGEQKDSFVSPRMAPWWHL